MLRLSLPLAALHLACLWHAAAAARAANGTQPPDGTPVRLPAYAPPAAAPLVATHVSFSIEQDRWPDWAGTAARNAFTFQALANLQQLTGAPPKIRVGANSEDRSVWSPAVPIAAAAFPPPSALRPYPEASNVTVGDGFYRLARWLPPGTHMTWGVNLGRDDPTNAANMAQSIVRAFAAPDVQAADVHLDFLELGNEADLYKDNGLRPANWTVADYVADWTRIAGPVVAAAPGVPLQGAAFGHSDDDFTPRALIAAGLLDAPPGRAITQISQHHYSGAFCAGGAFALASFMDKAAVRGNLSGFAADVAAVQRRGMPYVLGETNSIACHGAPGVSNTAGAALWAIDYTLQAATRGIVETYFHQGIGYKYNFFQPAPLPRSPLDAAPLAPPQPPHVQPAYYAALLVAHAAGRTGRARVAELAVPHARVAGYAVYEGEDGRLARAVFVNLEAWLAGARPGVHVELDVEGAGAYATVSVRRLRMGRADDVAGVTLGGVSYETRDARASGEECLEVVSVADGVDLAATEAVLLYF